VASVGQVFRIQIETNEFAFGADCLEKFGRMTAPADRAIDDNLTRLEIE
jgi:hypothetical protein